MSIRLGGVRDVDLGFRVLEASEEPLLPSTRDRTLSIPGRHGLYDFGAELDARPFTYKCAFVSDGTDYAQPSAAGLQQQLRRLARHLLDSYGRPKEMDLVREWEPDKTYRVRLSGLADLERVIYGSVGLFTLPLIAYDPFARDAEKIRESTCTSSPAPIEIVSAGDVRAEPVLVLTNTGTNIIRGLRITNEYIRE